MKSTLKNIASTTGFNSDASHLGFLIAHTARIGTQRQLNPGVHLAAVPIDAELTGTMIAHTALLGRNLGGIRQLLQNEPSATHLQTASDKAHPWSGFTVLPFRARNPVGHGSGDTPFGEPVDPALLPELSETLGVTCHQAWTTDLEGLLSVCYFGTKGQRQIGALLVAHLKGQPHLADMGSGCQVESRPRARKPIRLYFHTAETWVKTHGLAQSTAEDRRKAYALWRFEAMKMALVLHSLYQIPYEVVRASQHGPQRSMDLRSVEEPWLADLKPCAVPLSRAAVMRVVAHRFGSEMTLFHDVFLADANGREHVYGTYYCLLQDSESGLLQYLASLAEQHGLRFEMQAEHSAQAFT